MPWLRAVSDQPLKEGMVHVGIAGCLGLGRLKVPNRIEQVVGAKPSHVGWVEGHLEVGVVESDLALLQNALLHLCFREQSQSPWGMMESHSSRVKHSSSGMPRVSVALL